MIQTGIWILEVGSIAAALHLPLWVFARKRGQFFSLDVALPFISILSWLIYTELRIGSTASLANLIEVPIVAALSLATYGLKLAGAFGKSTRASIITIIVAMTAVLVLRLIMPSLPE